MISFYCYTWLFSLGHHPWISTMGGDPDVFHTHSHPHPSYLSFLRPQTPNSITLIRLMSNPSVLDSSWRTRRDHNYVNTAFGSAAAAKLLVLLRVHLFFSLTLSPSSPVVSFSSNKIHSDLWGTLHVHHAEEGSKAVWPLQPALAAPISTQLSSWHFPSPPHWGSSVPVSCRSGIPTAISETTCKTGIITWI